MSPKSKYNAASERYKSIRKSYGEETRPPLGINLFLNKKNGIDRLLRFDI